MKKLMIMAMVGITMFTTTSIGANATVIDNSLKNGWAFYENSVEKIGWLNYNNNWYYFGEDGIMAKGTQCINNNWYYFYEDGVMAHDATLGDCVFNSNGVLIQN